MRIGAKCLALLVTLSPSAASQTIRGQILGPDSSLVAGAVITAVSLPDSAFERTISDTAGRYSINLQSASGRYSVTVTRQGFALQRREVNRGAGTGPAVADFRLVALPQVLQPVTTRAARPRPSRTEQQGDFGPGQSGRLAIANTVDRSDGLTGNAKGEIGFALSMLPWMTPSQDATGAFSVSAFGLAGDQSAITLNGMAVRSGAQAEGTGAAFPRDGFRLEAVPATYDPAIGGFAGALVSLRFPSGNLDRDRTVHYSLDAPPLQWATPSASGLGVRYEQHVISGTAKGPITPRHFYNVSYQLDRQMQDVTPLVGASPSALAAQSISADSVARFVTILSRLGIPVGSSAQAAQQARSGTIIARLDYKPEPRSPTEAPDIGFSPSDNQLALTVNAGATDHEVIGGPRVTSTVGSRSSTFNIGATAMASSFLFGSILNELNVAGGANVQHTTSPFAMPSADVFVNSVLPNGATGTATLRAGGGGATPSDNNAWSVELKNQTAWYTWDRRHLFKVSLDGVVDGYALSPGASYGGYVYSSLGALEQGVPAAFTRTVATRQTSGRAFAGALGVGDIYAPFINMARLGQLELQYGIRVEANWFSAHPLRNAFVDSALHLRTDRVPSMLTLVPMLGFTRSVGSITRFVGSSPSARGSVFGGIREYRGALDQTRIDDAVRHDGVSDAEKYVTCVGVAVPTPDWAAFLQSPARIPRDCSDQSSSSLLTATQPSVVALSNGFEPTRSWRATIGASGFITKRFSGVLYTTLMANSHLASFVDVNLQSTPRFVNEIENRRPVYVNPSTIVPSTGAMTPTDSRRFAQFGSVMHATSDLRGRLWQTSAVLVDAPVPLGVQGRIGWRETVGYTFTAGRNESRGYGGTTAGDPAAAEWANSSVSKHVFTAGASLFLSRWMNLGLSARIASPIALTPRVGNDVNGDGLANDRAFVFDPSRTSDSVVAGGMTSLISAAPRSLSACLRRQLRTVARINSCAGPWSATVNLVVAPDPYRLKLGNRGSIQLVATNVLGAVDRLFHGSSRLRGWGPAPSRDPTLLYVRGFDPSTRQFLYTVNQGFGDASAARGLTVPFRVTLDARVYIGPDRESEHILAYVTGESRSERPTAQEIKNQMARAPFTVFDQVIRLRQRANLTDAQVDSLQVMKRQYAVYHDSVFAELAAFLASRNGAYTGETVREHWHSALEASQRWIYGSWPRVRALLHDDQYLEIPESQRAVWELSPAMFGWLMRQPLAIPR